MQSARFAFTIAHLSKHLNGLFVAERILALPLSYAVKSTCNRTVFPALTSSRYGSTFTDMTAQQLWDGCSNVSNAGKKRGRGKRGSVKKKVDLTAGKSFGFAKTEKYVWPGLNAPVVKGSEVLQMTHTKKDPDADKEIIALRDERSKVKRRKKLPLERGWSGSKLPGMSAGPLDPVGDCTFEGFDSRVLEFKLVSHMTGNLGRKQSYSALVVVGNGKGLVGSALAKASLGNAAVRKAKKMAAQRLQYLELKDSRTIFHNFHVQVGATHVFGEPKPPGYGLVCHRAIKTIAQLIGIEDIYCKVEGRSKNIQNVTAAFISGLLTQENHQKLADQSGYHVVQISDKFKVPQVLASPSGRTVQKTPVENWDFKRHYYGGKTKLRKGQRPRFYMKLPSYHHKKQVMYKRRDQRRCAIKRQAAQIQ